MSEDQESPKQNDQKPEGQPKAERSHKDIDKPSEHDEYGNPIFTLADGSKVKGARGFGLGRRSISSPPISDILDKYFEHKAREKTTLKEQPKASPQEPEKKPPKP